MNISEKNIKTLEDNLDLMFDRQWKEECNYTEAQEHEGEEYNPDFDYCSDYDDL